MWKDEKFGLANKALLGLIPKNGKCETGDQRSFLAQYDCWDEDFQHKWSVDEFPVIQICRTQQRVETRRTGMYHPHSGCQVVYEISGEPVFDDRTGEFLGGMVVLKDVTEYTTQIAAQIEANEKQFEIITNFMPVMGWTASADGVHDWFSRRWYDYSGLTVEQSLGEGWKIPIHPDDVGGCEKLWSDSIQNGVEYNTEHRCRRHDGKWRWVLGRALPFRDSFGRIIKWFGTCIDIHDQVEARQEAREMKEQLQRVIEHARIILWAANRDNKIVLFEGDMGHKLLEANNTSMIGRSLEQFVNKFQSPDLPQWNQAIQEVLRGNPQDEIVQRAISQDRWYRTLLAPRWQKTRDDGAGGGVCIDGVVGISMDITELHDREKQLKEQGEENARLTANAVAAKEASRLKSQFLANMSHEIRTPIASVIGMSELLLHTELANKQKEYATNIYKSSNNLLTVINDILDLSKVESGRLDVEMVPFDIVVILEDVDEMISFAAHKQGLVYKSFVQSELETSRVLMGDPGRLRQVLINILSNAVKFTPRGSVSLEATIEHRTNERIMVHLTIQDTGIGIDEEACKRLFQPFSQADQSTARQFGGTGLGLTISKRLVELMKGKIQLNSKPRQGTTVHISIPFGVAHSRDLDLSSLNWASISNRIRDDASVLCEQAENITHQPAFGQFNRDSSIKFLPPLGASNLHREDIHILVVEDK
jgi:PAS domain S-box-containing protein